MYFEEIIQYNTMQYMHGQMMSWWYTIAITNANRSNFVCSISRSSEIFHCHQVLFGQWKGVTPIDPLMTRQQPPESWIVLALLSASYYATRRNQEIAAEDYFSGEGGHDTH